MARDSRGDDDLAYGEYHGHDCDAGREERDRGLLGDVWEQFRGRNTSGGEQHPVRLHEHLDEPLDDGRIRS